MTIPMPEPISSWYDDIDNTEHDLITTTQAESYADARVREALEDSAALCDRFAERGMHPTECAGAIRAMIPTDPRPGQP